MNSQLLLPLLLMLVVAIPLVMGSRKQKRAAQEQQQLLNSLSEGDRVMPTPGTRSRSEAGGQRCAHGAASTLSGWPGAPSRSSGFPASSAQDPLRGERPPWHHRPGGSARDAISASSCSSWSCSTPWCSSP